MKMLNSHIIRIGKYVTAPLAMTIALLCVWVGCQNNGDTPDAAETVTTNSTATPAISATENIYVLSPSLRYGITFVKEYSADGRKLIGRDVYLVEVVDLKSRKYRILDTLPENSESHVFGDTGVCTIVCRGTRADPPPACEPR